jgi:hypothetical protein
MPGTLPWPGRICQPDNASPTPSATSPTSNGHSVLEIQHSNNPKSWKSKSLRLPFHLACKPASMVEEKVTIFPSPIPSAISPQPIRDSMLEFQRSNGLSCWRSKLLSLSLHLA